MTRTETKGERKRTFFFLTTLLGISDKYLNKTKVHNK